MSTPLSTPRQHISRRTFLKLAGLLAGGAGCVPPQKPDQLVRPSTAAAPLPMPTLPPQLGQAAWRIPAGSLVRISPAGVAVEVGQLLLVPVP